VRKFPPGPDQTFEVLDVNGWPALVGRRAGEVTWRQAGAASLSIAR